MAPTHPTQAPLRDVPLWCIDPRLLQQGATTTPTTNPAPFMSAAGVGAPGAPAPGPAAGVVPPGLSAAAVAAGAPGAAPPSAPASAAGPPASAAASAAPPATAAEREARRREHNKKRDQASRSVEGDLRKEAFKMVGADNEPAKADSSQESRGARQWRRLIAVLEEVAALRSENEDLKRRLEAAEKRE